VGGVDRRESFGFEVLPKGLCVQTVCTQLGGHSTSG